MRRWVLFGLIAVLILATLYGNAVILIDAYGSGPPYYGRTTNMDKWVNPLPILSIIDLVAVTIVVWLLRLAAKMR